MHINRFEPSLKSLNRTVNDLSLSGDIDSHNLRYVLYYSEAAAVRGQDQTLGECLTLREYSKMRTEQKDYMKIVIVSVL